MSIIIPSNLLKYVPATKQFRRWERLNKEITITFTAEFTEIIKDPQNVKFVENNDPEDLRKCLEQDMRSNTNYDDIHVRDFKVFIGGDE